MIQTSFSKNNLPALFGEPLVALAVACLIEQGPLPETVVAWMDLSAARGADLNAFCHVLDLEHSFADATLAFSEAGYRPRYANPLPATLDQLAKIFEVDRVLCFAALAASGTVYGERDYSDQDLSVVQCVAEEFLEFRERAGGVSPLHSTQVH